MKDWKYILYVAVVLILFVVIKASKDKEYDWTVTFSHEDKNPYGTFALHQVMGDVFDSGQVRHSYKTIYEWKDSIPPNANVFLVATSISCDKTDTDAILKHVADGGNAFISAETFGGVLADTLDLVAYDNFFSLSGDDSRADTSFLRFVNPSLDTVSRFPYKRDHIHNYFDRFDTTRTTVVARNDNGLPVTLHMEIGKGSIILNCTPMVFTNIYFLSNNNFEFVAATMSLLPATEVFRTEFYHLGKMESQSPLRFVLTNENLSWAYYIAIGSVLVFILFESKRRQRVIPVITPPSNTTLEFVSTIGNLYFQKADHKNMAQKKIQYFLDYIRSKYHLPTFVLDDQFITLLTQKSGRNLEQVLELTKTINYIQKSTLISSQELMMLDELLDRFYAPTH